MNRSGELGDVFYKNFDNWKKVLQWIRWYPDLFLDLITPETGGIRLDLDQRVFMRVLFRFIRTYGVFPRGYGKTFVEILVMYVAGIAFPNLNMYLTAQTKENAIALLNQKHEEIMGFYPMLRKEISNVSISNNDATVTFGSGAWIKVLANAQESKGRRGHRINAEEAALIKAQVFEDALEPIVDIPRRTIGRQAVVNPYEPNGQINFLTTAGFKGTSEFDRSIKMVDDMANLEGNFVIGSDYNLALNYGRGLTKSQILAKKDAMSPISFAQNYESKWVGATDGALVNINDLLDCRNVKRSEESANSRFDYIVSMDVARAPSTKSNKNRNAQSFIVVIKLARKKDGTVSDVSVVHLKSIKGASTNTVQALELKKTAIAFNAKAVVIDANGLGIGLYDELMKEHTDPVTGVYYHAYEPTNLEDKSEYDNPKKIMYALKSTKIQTEVTVNFMNYVASKKLKLLTDNYDKNYDIDDIGAIEKLASYIETDLLIEEIANLKMIKTGNGGLSVQKVVSKLEKDRYSALSYGLWYIKEFEDRILAEDDTSLLEMMFIN